MIKYRLVVIPHFMGSSEIQIQKYIHYPDGPDDFNGMPTYLSGSKWVKVEDTDIPEIHKLLNPNE